MELISATLPVVDTRKGRPHVLYLNVQNLKIVNDTLGLAAGDKMLRDLASQLNQIIGDSGTVSSLGGGFGVLLKPCGIEAALQISSQALTALNNFRLVEQDMTFSIQAAGGLVAIDMNLVSADEVLSSADLACRQADLHAETPLAVYQTDMLKDAHANDSEQLAVLTSDLENNRLQLQFQPIINTQTGKTVWLEALLSNYDADGKLNLAGGTLLAAERHGIVWRFDRWVINESIRQLAENPDKATDGVLMNVSPQTLQHNDFASYVLERLKAHNVQPNNICFDVTAGTLADELQVASDNLVRLARRGCNVALDDFGTGSGSLQSLRDLPANYIKINHVFLDGLSNNDLDQIICSSIVDLAERCGCEVIAESVQDVGRCALLEKLGIYLAQGYAFGAPMTMREIGRTNTKIPDKASSNIVSLKTDNVPENTARAGRSG